MSVEAVLSQVEELTLEQRAELLQRLETDLIEAGWQPEFASGEWSEEIRTRIEDVRSGRVKSVPWVEAREQILADDDGAD